MDLKQARILLTGASGGFGQELARQLSAAGAELVLSARRREVLDRLAAELTQSGGKPVEDLVADWSSNEGRQALSQRTQSAQRPINTLVLNAALNSFGSFESQSDHQLTELLSANLLAPMRLVREVLPSLKARESARLVFINSTFGRLGHPGYASYCAAKHGLKGFAEALRRELLGSSVQVIEISPRAMRTAMNGPAAQAVNRAAKSTEDSPAVVAAATLKAMRSDRARLLIGFPERWFIRLNALFPRLLDRALGTSWPKLHRVASAASQPPTRTPVLDSPASPAPTP